MVPSAVVEAGIRAEAAGVDEVRLNWWREDPEANEHHDHWHVVYPTGGVPAPTPQDPGRTRLQDRQGELFFYMHQQMLARYDTERTAVGLELVEPITDHAAPIPEGSTRRPGWRVFRTSGPTARRPARGRTGRRCPPPSRCRAGW